MIFFKFKFNFEYNFEFYSPLQCRARVFMKATPFFFYVIQLIKKNKKTNKTIFVFNSEFYCN